MARHVTTKSVEVLLAGGPADGEVARRLRNRLPSTLRLVTIGDSVAMLLDPMGDPSPLMPSRAEPAQGSPTWTYLEFEAPCYRATGQRLAHGRLLDLWHD